MFQQNGKNLKWLTCEFQLQPVPAQFTSFKVNFKGSEPDQMLGMDSVLHGAGLKWHSV
jgi:hypothetical protein